jgi:antitoxin component YwqK of YwqJK toxin-antitoxin module
MRQSVFKNLLVILTLVGFTSSVDGQNTKVVNQTDGLGRKTGTWEGRYPDGQLRYTGQFKQGKPTGEFKYFFESGKLRATNTFDNTGLRAYHRSWAENGILVAEGIFFNQMKDSTWRFYSDLDGSLVSEDDFLNNMQHGTSKTYYPASEQVAEIATWQNGKKNGPWKKFFPHGSIMAEGSYTDDQPDGQIVFYHPNGKTHIRGSYHQGLKTGRWETYDENGNLIGNEEYKERGY